MVRSSGREFWNREEKPMQKDNRVIHRIGAREVTLEELTNVTGGIHTLTICTFATAKGVYGDEAGPEVC